MSFIHDNEHDFTWENTINIGSHGGYYILEGLANAQSFLLELSIESSRPYWKKLAQTAWQGFTESLRYSPVNGTFKHII